MIGIIFAPVFSFMFSLFQLKISYLPLVLWHQQLQALWVSPPVWPFSLTFFPNEKQGQKNKLEKELCRNNVRKT